MAGYVYVIENENGRVKIGKSVDPEKRIMSIQMISGYKVVRKYITPELHQYSKLETFFHNHFNENRSIGEWLI
jgi:T5orf172 domain.